MSAGAVTGIIFGCFGALILGCIIGFIIGAVFTKKQVKKHLDKNPPINEQQIRAMYAQMGKKPSESQIKQIMNQYKKNK